MTDSVKGYLYGQDVRIKIARLKTTVDQISERRNFSAAEQEKFIPAALFAAVYATEQKDDDGSVYISFKFPDEKKAYTAICETDGRLRGYQEDFVPNNALNHEILFISGVRLSLRGDYQSAIAADNIHATIRDFYKNSRQTKAEFSFFSQNGANGLIIAEYLPGHDVNYRSEEKLLSEETVRQKLKKAIGFFSETLLSSPEKSLPEEFKEVLSLEVHFGCTCSKRKIKQALASSGETDLEFPLSVSCKFCGKEYTIESF